MKEFSEVTGLSRPTVSKYFHDPASVRPSTRAKIETALKKYDYLPNFLAVNQNRRNPKTVGIIVPHLVDPFYAELVGRIERECIGRGYSAIIQSSHGSRDDEDRAIDMMRALNIGGVILSPLGAASDLGKIEMLAEEVPVLLVDSHVGKRLPAITCDNAQGIGVIVEHLCREGAPPVYIDMPDVNSTATERREAYIAAMEANGRAPVVLGGGPVRWDFEQFGYEVARAQLVNGGFAYPAVLCANDRFAMGVFRAACELGLRIGKDGDFRLAGHDDHPFADFTCPGLTTVAQDVEGLAAGAVDMILDLMTRGETAERLVRLPSRLVLRDSA
ncbi:LacI family DNA-binding transcriptional regulator [Sinisalibacter aestuarii]|nr:LacI family DNA-binding transcriptional regulator [Sinisalibacter aestuarii]